MGMVAPLYECTLDTAVSIPVLMLLCLVSLLSDMPWPWRIVDPCDSVIHMNCNQQPWQTKVIDPFHPLLR